MAGFSLGAQEGRLAEEEEVPMSQRRRKGRDMRSMGFVTAGAPLGWVEQAC